MKIFKDMYLICILLGTIILPIVICMLPAILYIMTDQAFYMWFMIITFPFGCALAMNWWDYKHIDKISNYDTN